MYFFKIYIFVIRNRYIFLKTNVFLPGDKEIIYYWGYGDLHANAQMQS